MKWTFLPAMIVGTVLVAAGCSSTRPDPASRQKGAAESSDLMALRRDNDALRQEQLQSQRQIEQLNKQIASDREEQRRFREMMSTNFDLLEQSVSVTLAKSGDKGPPNPPPGARGATPAALADDPGRIGAAMTSNPRPPAGSAPASAQPAQGTDAKPATAGKPESRTAPGEGRPVAAKTEARGPGAADSKAPGTTARPNGSSGSNANKSAAPVLAVAGVGVAAKSGPPAAAGLQTSNGKPYEDPDLEEPSKPRQLSANRAAKPLYDKGFVLFGNRQYEQSVLVYRNFLNRYPDDIYSDNAQFWIGEAYLRMDKLDDAEAAYRKVLREYAHKSTLEGYKTPDAIYRIGQIYAKRSNEKLARYYLQAVAQRFPDSSAGRKAVRDLGDGASLTSQASTGGVSTGG